MLPQTNILDIERKYGPMFTTGELGKKVLSFSSQTAAWFYAISKVLVFDRRSESFYLYHNLSGEWRPLRKDELFSDLALFIHKMKIAFI